MNCVVAVPLGMLRATGVTAMDCKDTAFTVNAALPETVPLTPGAEPVIVVEPGATAEANPAVLTVPTAKLEDVHVAVLVRVCVVPSV